jgi:hypothetical protein
VKTPRIIRPTKLTMALPEDIRAKLDLYLYSEAQQRIPHGAYQKFMVERISDFFRSSEPGFNPEDLPEADLPEAGKVMEKTYIGRKDDRVVVQFPTSRRGLSMHPQVALALASAIIQAAREVK